MVSRYISLLYTSIHYHQWTTLIQYETIFTSQLSTNCNNFNQNSVIQTKAEQSTIPTKPIFLIVYPSINTWSGSSENIHIYTESTTVTTSKLQFCVNRLLWQHIPRNMTKYPRNLIRYLKNKKKTLKNNKNNWSSLGGNNMKN